MSVQCCSYKNCYVRRATFSSLTFFRFPNDERRKKWIENSGNSLLKKLTEKQIRFICERHFHKDDIREQSLRKILSKKAIPMPYQKELEHEYNVRKPKVASNKENHNESESLEIIILGQDSVENFKDSTPNESNYIENELSEDYQYCVEDSSVMCLSDDIQTFSDTKENQNLTESLEISLIEDFEEDSKYELSEISTISEDVLSKASKNIDFQEISTNYDDRNTPIFMEPLEKTSEMNTGCEDLLIKDVQCSTTTHKVQITDAPDTRFQTTADYESDRHFALSLTNYFQRLNHRKRAKAKIDTYFKLFP